MNKSEHFANVLPRYLNRRGFLKSLSAIGASAALPACSDKSVSAATQPPAKAPNVTPTSLPFTELAQGLDEQFAVAEGYDYQPLLSWGDPLFEGVGEFDISALSEHEQTQRFGYNNDYVGFLPLPLGSNSATRGLLVVNHEYTQPELMYKGSPSGLKLNKQQVDVDIAAHGLSIVEIQKRDTSWQPVLSSAYNRRIMPTTPVMMTGAASGSARLQTIISQDGVHSLGTYGNCAGGITPWGTVLTAEENVDEYFSGNYKDTAEAANYKRFGMGDRRKNWGEHYQRWDLDKNPNELLHVGWIVEIDPYDPESVPRKRTSLGRCKHEGCNVFINSDNRVVAYTGDDEAGEYIYKFVSKNKYQPENRAANMSILEEGTLYVARFNDDGSLNWLPLVFGDGPLVQANGFASQADVCIDSRKAADLVNATKMDRPEDVEVNLVNGRVYAMLTKNPTRLPGTTDAANPRSLNTSGQIVEFWPEGGDHTSRQFNWDMFLIAGNPEKTVTKYHPDTTVNGWLACPDNCAFDNLGNLWIATDGADFHGVADGVWACEVDGKNKALTKRFLRTPIGAELCGPTFTPDNENFFVSVQHPGGNSTYDKPDTRWPDFNPAMPPRPTVVVITKRGGGRIGS